MAVKHSFVILSLPVVLTIAGCGATRDAATEAPIDLQPGRYEISFEGAAFGMRAPGQKEGPNSSNRSICVTENVAKKWPRIAMTGHLGNEGKANCEFDNEKRTGNAFSGEYICDSEQDRMPGGKVKLAYTGTVSATESVIDTKMGFEMPDPSEMPAKMAEEMEQLKKAQPLLNAVSVIITAKRTGDCTGGN